MASYSRRKQIGKERKSVFHCTARCVRRAYLCGRDRVTGQDYSHRRDWIIRREEQLAKLFAIEIEFRTEMSNHLHAVLRTRPDVARRLTPREVVRRWLTITKLAKCMSDDLPEPSQQRIDRVVSDKERVAKMRQRLSSISWFMGILLENIARRANREEGSSGRFWENRFKCRECTDEASILLCGVYVDLNPIMSGEADDLETARYTSVFQRLLAEQEESKNAASRPDGWMAELTLQPERKADVDLAYTSRSGRRASDLGILPISLQEYVQLLRWTAQLLRSGQRSTIPKNLGDILDRLNMSQETWVDTVDSYDITFCRAIGPPAELEKVALRLDVHHLKGTSASRRLFG